MAPSGRRADHFPSPLSAVVRLTHLPSVRPNFPKSYVVPLHCSASASRTGRSRLHFSLSRKTIDCDLFHIGASKPSSVAVLVQERGDERNVTIVLRNIHPGSGGLITLVLVNVYDTVCFFFFGMVGALGACWKTLKSPSSCEVRPSQSTIPGSLPPSCPPAFHFLPAFQSQ